MTFLGLKKLPSILCGILASSLLVTHAENLPPSAQGIVDAERAFALLARQANTRDAFLAYFTDESISFGPGLQKGRARLLQEAVDDSFLEWSPAFVDVAVSGDFGYDLGPWSYRIHRTDLNPVAWGTFVTLWKRRPDGAWRVALDLGTTHRPSPEAVPLVPATPARKLAKMDALRGGDPRADLLTVERDFISRFARDGSNAFLSSLSTEARLYRPGLTPALSASAIRNYFESQRSVARAAYELIDGETASTGDLGYVYGWVTTEKLTTGKTETKRSNYLRIWKREEGRNWKVVLDVIGAN
jgi:ketosteroid isomerase-like protein